MGVLRGLSKPARKNNVFFVCLFFFVLFSLNITTKTLPPVLVLVYRSSEKGLF